MNEFNDSSWEDDQRFDRLVDGELGPEEYNDLLRSLDQRPEGWRRCALAFLEAQAFRRELAELAGEPDMSVRASRLSDANTSNIRRWPALLAVAASFLLAFGMGVLFQGGWSGTPSETEGVPIVKEDPRSESPGEPPRDVEIAETPTPKATQPSDYRGNVKLIVERPDGSGSDEFETPLYELSPENAWMLSEDRFRAPPEIERMLQRMGRELRWDQQVVPLETDDGQRVLIPFRQLEITPVGGQRYQ